jgi:GNAT superfamily N-acetyltransferase
MNSQLQIRLAKEQDSTALLELFKQHAAYEGHKLAIHDQAQALTELSHCPLSIFVVEEKNALQGYMSLVPQYSTWEMKSYLYLDCLFLKPTLRGKGIGKKLMLSAAEYAKKQGIKQIQWQTPQENSDAIAFYKNLGAVDKTKNVSFGIYQVKQ